MLMFVIDNNFYGQEPGSRVTELIQAARQGGLGENDFGWIQSLRSKSPLSKGKGLEEFKNVSGDTRLVLVHGGAGNDDEWLDVLNWVAACKEMWAVVYRGDYRTAIDTSEKVQARARELHISERCCTVYSGQLIDRLPVFLRRALKGDIDLREICGREPRAYEAKLALIYDLLRGREGKECAETRIKEIPLGEDGDGFYVESNDKIKEIQTALARVMEALNSGNIRGSPLEDPVYVQALASLRRALLDHVQFPKPEL